MKMITAVIKPHKLEDVREAVAALGIHGMTATEVKGYGRQGGHTEIYRGAEYTVHFLPKIKLEIACSDEIADRVVEAVRDEAHSGRVGDGKVFVYDLEQALRIRTGETGEEAL